MNLKDCQRASYNPKIRACYRAKITVPLILVRSQGSPVAQRYSNQTEIVASRSQVLQSCLENSEFFFLSHWLKTSFLISCAFGSFRLLGNCPPTPPLSDH